MPASAPPASPAPSLQRAVGVAAALVVAGLLAARLVDVLLMAFGAILFATLLHAVAGPLRRRARLGPKAALTASVALIVLAAAGVLLLFGSQAEAQLANLANLLPRAWAVLHLRLASFPFGGQILHELDSARADGWLLNLGPRLASNAAAAVAGTVIVSFAGLYLAFHPQSYFKGLLALVPPRRREGVAEVLHACQTALQQWMVGQLISMVIVGLSVGVGLWLAGAPSPVALGAIAGIGQFVPVVGPMAAAVPGLLAAIGQSPATFGWALAIYVGASQLEANLITPLVLRRMVELPMAVTLFAVLAMGVLLGPLGVVFATPLAVVAYVAVKRVWVEGVLGGAP